MYPKPYSIYLRGTVTPEPRLRQRNQEDQCLQEGLTSSGFKGLGLKRLRVKGLGIYRVQVWVFGNEGMEKNMETTIMWNQMDNEMQHDN